MSPSWACPLGLPQPDKHLHIPADENREETWVPFQTRRGCPMCCSYCSTPLIEGGFIRRQSVTAAVENLKAYTAAGYKRFFFVDNTFNGRHRRHDLILVWRLKESCVPYG